MIKPIITIDSLAGEEVLSTPCDPIPENPMIYAPLFQDLMDTAIYAAKHKEIVVDLFCGGGGASVGIEAALGSSVDAAINHSKDAIRCHEQNHPGTRHYTTDVFDMHPLEVTYGRPVGLLWLSPDCTHFSKARGGAPKKKNIRSLATVGLWWAREVRPRVICLENVGEFTTWGRLDKRTNQPDPRYKGEGFHKFVRRLQQHGYEVESRELRACDYGAPTIRKRLFLIARCDGEPIVWPKATHGPNTDQPFHTAAECIDFSIPTVSIFATKEECKAAKLNARRPLADSTMERIARGIQKFVINNPKPFIIGIDNQSNSSGECSCESPLPTTTSKNRFALVESFIATCNHQGSSFRGQGMDEPMKTICANRDAHGLVTACLAKHYTGVDGQVLDKPLGTITSIDHHSLIACHIERQNGESRGESIKEPLSSITADVNKHALVCCHGELMHGTSRGTDLKEPLRTINAGGQHHGLVTSHLLSYHAAKGDESRCYSNLAPLPTLDTSNRYAEVRAFLMKYYGQGTGQELREPMHSIRGNDCFGLVTVHGRDYRIVDIGLRMLTPDELLKAQFGKHAAGYRIDDMTKAQAVKMIGNSVCPDVPEAIVRANVRLRTWKSKR